MLARHCADLGYGPQRVREKLYEKGVPRELWDDAPDTLPDPAGQIDRFLVSKLRGRVPDEKEKSAFATPWPAGALPGRISGRDGADWGRRSPRSDTEGACGS